MKSFFSGRDLFVCKSATDGFDIVFQIFSKKNGERKQVREWEAYAAQSGGKLTLPDGDTPGT